MGEWPEAVEAALCATYAPRDPIGEFWRGEITLRELRVLVEGLPPDSAMHRRMPSLRGWDNTDYLLSDAIDALRSLFNLTLAANTEEGRYEPPEPYARPGDDERRAAAAKVNARRAESLNTIIDKLLPPRR